MTIDLWMLAWSAVLSVVLAFPYTLALIAKVGLPAAAGYPQPTHDGLADWAGRAKRAHMNMVENLPVFAAIVLVAHVAGVANETTALGAQIFFWARVVMAAGHTLALAFVRTVAWFVSLAGLVMILAQMF